MKLSSSLEIYPKPLQATFEDVESDDLEVFFAMGIVNPRGPTLCYVAAVGSAQFNIPRPVVFVMLNPFRQFVEQVGRLTISDDYHPSILDPLYRLHFGSCPTLLLMNSNSSVDLRFEIARKIFCGFDEGDVERVCVSVGGHHGDPATRVSNAMAGVVTARQSFSGSSIEKLSALVLDPIHIWPEIQALVFAWNGAINLAGIGDELKQKAFGVDRFKAHMSRQLLPCLWLPDTPPKDAQPPAVVPAGRYMAQTKEELRETMCKDAWDDFSLDELADLLSTAIALYGLEVNAGDVPNISRLYMSALRRGVAAETRGMLLNTAFKYVEERGFNPEIFLPFIVFDTDMGVVSTAVINFVSESPCVEGELYAVSELRRLFGNNGIAERGFAFGALIAMGDDELEPFLDSVRPTLSIVDVRKAAAVHTPFLLHSAIQYWLRWARSLVAGTDEESLSKFGSCATALDLCLRYAQMDKVADSKRHFPCCRSENPMTLRRTWTRHEYADLIAPDLYAIEFAEAAPKVFSDVLRTWGFQPHAQLIDQYIPQSSDPAKQFNTLKDVAGAGDPQAVGGADGFLAKLLNR